MNNDKIIEQMKDYLYKNKRIEAIQYEIGMEDGWIILLLNMPEGEDYVNKVFTTKSDAENYITSPLFTREHNGKEYKIVPVMLYVLSDDEAEICPHVVLDNRRIEHEFVPMDENSLLVVDECGCIEVMNNGTLSDFQEITSEEGGMQIKTKFSVGNIVYVCKNSTIKELETCKICDGKGEIIVKDESFCCPKCQGRKFTHTKIVKKYIPEKRIIKKVKVSITENNGNIQIDEKYDCETPSGKNRSVALYRNIMFSTMEETEARCKELMEEI